MKNIFKKKHSTNDIEIIFAFDRVDLYLDQSELPIAQSLLKQHCTKLEVTSKFKDYNPRWKLKVDLLQPTIECLRLLNKALGNNICAEINYVEIARDAIANNLEQALSWRNNFLSSAAMKYQRQTVVCHESTWYFGRRHDEEGKKRGNVLAVYADKPSKLNNARPDEGSIPCYHAELRSTGSAALARHGISALTDLIEFDHEQFWNDNITIYQLPKPTELGKLLAEIAGANANVSGSALRKRAKNWILKNSINGQFVMHNGLLIRAELKPKLETVPFTDWLKRTVTEL